MWQPLALGIIIGAASGASLVLFLKDVFRGSKQKNRHQNTSAYFYWPLLGCGLAFAMLAGLLFILKVDIFSESTWFEFVDNRRVNEAEGARNIFLSVGGLAATVVGALTLGNAVRRSATMERQEGISRKLEINDRHRLEADTFTKAAELLGSENEHQRLGAIHSLTHLARTATGDLKNQIADTLAAFVRHQSIPVIIEANVVDAPANADESISAALKAILNGFANGEHQIDLSGAYISNLVVDDEVKNVIFDRCVIRKMVFNNLVSGVRFTGIRDGGHLIFCGAVRDLQIENAVFQKVSFQNSDVLRDANINGLYLYDCVFVQLIFSGKFVANNLDLVYGRFVFYSRAFDKAA